jgi:hypothetical protein
MMSVNARIGSGRVGRVLKHRTTFSIGESLKIVRLTDLLTVWVVVSGSGTACASFRE